MLLRLFNELSEVHLNGFCLGFRVRDVQFEVFHTSPPDRFGRQPFQKLGHVCQVSAVDLVLAHISFQIISKVSQCIGERCLGVFRDILHPSLQDLSLKGIHVLAQNASAPTVEMVVIQTRLAKWLTKYRVKSVLFLYQLLAMICDLFRGFNPSVFGVRDRDPSRYLFL